MPVYQAGSNIWSTALIDVNGDGVLDIITANNNSNDVSVLIGNPNGTFQPQRTFPAGLGSGALALADFNGDGKVDIATANNNRGAAPGSVSVLLNQGNAQFGTATSFQTGTDPIYIAAADFNLDGRIDLVTADAVSKTLSVLLGNGDGSFQSPRATFTASSASIALADFNEDGKPDVVTAGQIGSTGGHVSNFVSVFLGNGDGTFQDSKNAPIPHQPTKFAVGDFNGDGHADIAASENSSNEFSVFLGKGDGTFQAAISAPIQAPYDLAVGDVDHDNRQDLIVSGFGTSKVYLLLGDGDGTFQVPHGYGVQGDPLSVAIGDINGDGTPDIAAGAGSSVSVLLSQPLHHDFNAPDLVSSRFGRSDAAGGFSSNDLYPRELADVNGDGKADIVGFGENAVFVALGKYDGSFGSPSTEIAYFGAAVSAGSWTSNELYPRQLADVNGDGLADIVGFGKHGVEVALATGGGHFGAASLVLAQFGAEADAGGWTNTQLYPRELADVNGDGMADIIGFGEHGVYVSLATGGGHFGGLDLTLAQFGRGSDAGGWTSTELYPREVADVNGDGKADIVGFGEHGVYVATATGGGHFGGLDLVLAQFGFGPDAGGWSSQDLYPRELADVNGDGRADLVGFGEAGAYTSFGQSDGHFGGLDLAVQQFGTGSQAGGWSSQDQYPRKVADVTGDGMADIVGFGEHGAYVASSFTDFFHL
jgi:trimeric autotransporter adhesin